MSINLIKRIPQSDIYDFTAYPYSSGQRYFTEDNIYYLDIEGERFAAIDVNSSDDIQTAIEPYITAYPNLKGHMLIVKYDDSLDYDRWYVRPEDGIVVPLRARVTSGVSEAPTLTEEGLNIIIGHSHINLYSTTNFSGNVHQYSFESVTFPRSTFSLTNINYIVAEKSITASTPPVIKVTQDLSSINSSNVVPIFTVERTSQVIKTSSSISFNDVVPYTISISSDTFPKLEIGGKIVVAGGTNNGKIFDVVSSNTTSIVITGLTPPSLQATGTSITLTECIFHILPWGEWGKGLADKLNRRLIKTERFKRESGLSVAVNGTSTAYTISVGEGVVWYGDSVLNLDSIDSIDSTTPLWIWYHTGATTFKYDLSNTIPYIGSLYCYDNLSSTYGLQPVQNNTKYSTIWVFREMSSHNTTHIVFSNSPSQSLSEAQENDIPVLPTILQSQGLLVARIILNGDGTTVDIESAFATFSGGGGGGGVTVHNDLIGRDSADAHPISSITGLQEIFNLTGEPTGFDDCNNMVVTYNGTTARTITLTHTGSTTYFNAYYSGSKIVGLSDTTSWTSPQYETADGIFPKYLSSRDGLAPTWSTEPWSLDVLQVAIIEKTTSGDYFVLRETHGFMPWQAHEEFHQRFGTYKLSGGALSSYGTIPSNRYPLVGLTKIEDEDLETDLQAMSTPSYTRIYLSSTDTANWSINQSEILPFTGSTFPYYNSWSGSTWSTIALTNNEYTSVWLMAFNVAKESGGISSPYRFAWLMGQSKGSLNSQENLVPGDLSLGSLTTYLPEFVFLAKVIIKCISNNWQIEKVYYLDGDKTTQIISPGGIPYHMHDIADVLNLQSTLDDKISSSTTSTQTISGPLEFTDGSSTWQIDVSDGNFRIQQGSSTNIFTIYKTNDGSTIAYKIKIEGKTEITDLDFGGW